MSSTTLADCPSKTLKRFALITSLMFTSAACAPASAPAPEQVEFTGAIMGTTYHIKVVATMSDAESTATANAIEAALKRVDGAMSTYKPDSELSRFNQAAAGVPVAVSDETFHVFTISQQVNQASEGAFDITVGPLVNAWGFGPAERQAPPSDETIRTLSALTGPDKITLDPVKHTIAKAADGVYCDLSAIAKGYAVDKVAEAIAGRGHTRYMVEVGGEVRCAGNNGSNAPWHIAIEKPMDDERALEKVVGLRDVSLATSGNYRNFYMVDGKRMSHTIDPKTGRPVNHQLASASVIHAECAMADAYATAIMVLGPEKGLAFAEKEGLAVFLIIHSENEGLITRETESFAAKLVEPRP